MVNFSRTNNIIGWLLFLAALLVYALTLEPYVSYWDCGEFIAASYKLQVVHPPGAPLFQMLGRLFSLLSFGDETRVAFWVNMLSATSSALCVMFTYFITIRIAQKLINPAQLPITKNKAIVLWGSGIIAALTLTFSDTFWFSAVEAEVYALSSFFTMLVFWAALKYDDSQDNKPQWLLFIAFAVGLSIGVHLLNLLVVPAVVLVIVLSGKPFQWLRLLWGSALGVALLLFIQFIVIPKLPQWAADTDRWMVNGFGASYGVGIVLFFAILLIIITILLFISHKKQWAAAQIGLLCMVFILIGYSSYLMVPIRAAAKPPVNINAPADAYSFLSYLNRDQYGSRSLLHGPYFNAPIKDFTLGKEAWRPSGGKYVVTGRENEYEFDPAYTTFFPRMGNTFDGSSQTGYIGWTGVDPSKPPTFDKNLEFFFKYQVLHMYVRYHLWNFSGRQNNRQGHGNAVHGNGVSGISILDETISAPEENLPAILAQNKGRNFYYLLPLLLGLAGLLFHASPKNYGFWPLFLLFLFTGFFLCLYLNIPPFEPRERDYVFVGSFQVFSIWVGLGALWLAQTLQRRIPKGTWIGLIAAFLAAPCLMAAQNWDDHDRSGRSFTRDFARNYLQSLAPNAILFVYGDNDTYPLWYLQNVEGVRPDVRVVNANLLNTDWAAAELTEKKYDSEPLKLSISPDKYVYDQFELVKIENTGNAMELEKALALLAEPPSEKNRHKYNNGRERSKLSASGVYFNIPREKAIGMIAPTDTMYRVARFEVPLSSSALFRAELLLLDVIANNFLERPIYFASQSEAENLKQLNRYLRLEGLAYRLTPLQYPDSVGYFNRLNTRQMTGILKDFQLNGYNNPKLYTDPDALSAAFHYRNLYSLTAEKLMAEGDTSTACMLAAQCNQAFPCSMVDYKYPSPAINFIKAMSRGGYQKEAEQLTADLIAQLMQKTVYYNALKGGIADYEGRTEGEKAIKTLGDLKALLLQLNQPQKAAEIEKFLGFYK